MLRDTLNKSWRDYVKSKELYGKIPRITDTIREQRLKFYNHWWRNRSEVVSVTLDSTTRTTLSRKAYENILNQLRDDTMYTNKELPIEMSDREEWRTYVMNCRPGKVVR